MIDVVVMAGGKGSRLGGIRKQFLTVCGRRLIDIALEIGKHIGRRVYVCVSKDDVVLLENVAKDNIEVVVCSGLGYVEDLSYILKLVRLPVLVLPADMPFLTLNTVERFLDVAQKEQTDVVTLMVCKGSTCEETGISFFRSVGGKWVNVYFDYSPELRDIDTFDDLKWAEELCGSTEAIERPK